MEKTPRSQRPLSNKCAKPARAQGRCPRILPIRTGRTSWQSRPAASSAIGSTFLSPPWVPRRAQRSRIRRSPISTGCSLPTFPHRFSWHSSSFRSCARVAASIRHVRCGAAYIGHVVGLCGYDGCNRNHHPAFRFDAEAAWHPGEPLSFRRSRSRFAELLQYLCQPRAHPQWFGKAPGAARRCRDRSRRSRVQRRAFRYRRYLAGKRRLQP